MTKNRGVLLASFMVSATDENIQKEVEFIVNNIDITNKLIFLLEEEDDPRKKILTYNAIVEKGKTFNPRLFTMRVHRKKQTNTLYTINALNKAVALEHDGKTGRNLKLSWDKYANSILLTSGNDLRVHKVKVSKIYKIEDAPEEPEGE